MSVIQPQPRIERQAMTIKLEVPLIRALKLYAEYIHSSQEWVVNEGLRLTFTKDDGFQQWLRTHHADAVESVSVRRVSRRQAASRQRALDKPTAPTSDKSTER
jgi:hypothetical protein